jgi:hypothetical protein
VEDSASRLLVLYGDRGNREVFVLAGGGPPQVARVGGRLSLFRLSQLGVVLEVLVVGLAQVDVFRLVALLLGWSLVDDGLRLYWLLLLLAVLFDWGCVGGQDWLLRLGLDVLAVGNPALLELLQSFVPVFEQEAGLYDALAVEAGVAAQLAHLVLALSLPYLLCLSQVRQDDLLQLSMGLGACSLRFVLLQPFQAPAAGAVSLLAVVGLGHCVSEVEAGVDLPALLDVGGGPELMELHVAALALEGGVLVLDDFLDVVQVAFLPPPAVDLRERLVGALADRIREGLGRRHGVLVNHDQLRTLAKHLER